MTTFDQPAIDFPSAPIDGDTRAVVEAVANDWRSEEDWHRFESAVLQSVSDEVARFRTFTSNHVFYVDPNRVRELLTNDYGLTIEPRRYSAFWSRAAGKNGFLVADGWVLNEDTKGGNRGKPLRRYRLRNSP